MLVYNILVIYLPWGGALFRDYARHNILVIYLPWGECLVSITLVGGGGPGDAMIGEYKDKMF